MNWHSYATWGLQIFLYSLFAGVALEFIVRRIRNGWLRAQIDVSNEILKNEKNKALKEAMTKK